MAIARLSKEHLGLAAEFAVASELCRRDMYAQLTLGLRKRTDLLVDTKGGMLRVQVKAKQGSDWPNCRGVFGQNMVLVLVDFQDKRKDERPDFYVLTTEDWEYLLRQKLNKYISTGEVVIDEENVPVWVKQINKNGQPYRGMGVNVSQVRAYKEAWGKIRNMTGDI